MCDQCAGSRLSRVLAGGRWYRRLQAVGLARVSRAHERLVADRKRSLFAGIDGDIVEIGPGTGPNLAYLPATAHWTGVEPNPFLDRFLAAASARAAGSTRIARGVAEAIPVPTASVDYVIGTLVLCSVTDPARAVAEIRRVLRPGGQYLLLEHVAAPRGEPLRRAQDLLQPVWALLADNCHLNRETATTVRQAGFGRVEIEAFRLPLGPFSPHIIGRAIK